MAIRFWYYLQVCTAAYAIAGTGSANAQIPLSGFDFDDFIVAYSISDNIAVFDNDFTFKGFLDPDFNGVTGLDFDAQGRIVAVSAIDDEVRVYTPDGNQVSSLGFANPALGAAIDLKVGPSGNYFVGTQSSSGAIGVAEFTPSGDAVRSFDNPDGTDSADYDGVALLPGDVMWAGGFQAPPGDFIDVYDTVTGDLSGRIPLDNGQSSAVSMYYDPDTSTVLIVDIDFGENLLSDSDRIFERDLDGSFVRDFAVPDLAAAAMLTPLGVTRGPNGEVYATNQGTLGDADGNGIFVWDASGDFIKFINSEGGLRGPVGILYGGNNPIPEPTSLGLLCFGLLTLSRRRTA